MPNSNDISVRFFAALKDRAGTSVVEIQHTESMTVADAVAAARKATPSDPNPGESVMFAVNGEYVEKDELLSPGDELALIPPVSGGTGQIKTEDTWVFVTADVLEAEPLNKFVTTGVDGAVVTFHGNTRDHNVGRTVLYLDYEAYQPMAENKMAEIIAEMRERWELGKVAVGHRTGRVDIGETSMILTVGSAHRRPAFEASLYFIDRLKEVVPIWKKEYFEGGEVWIGETPG